MGLNPRLGLSLSKPITANEADQAGHGNLGESVHWELRLKAKRGSAFFLRKDSLPHGIGGKNSRVGP
jgi:hypothetical protein